MKTNRTIAGWLTLMALLTLNIQPSAVFAQGTTAFTYQGQLRDGGTNANGAYTMTFKLYDALTGGNQIGGTIINSPALANGLFTVNLDFGAGAFNGASRWLDITISNGVAQTLSPRVQVLPAPYAQFAATAATVTNSAITSTLIANNAVTNRNLTANAVNATNIASGQVVKSLEGLTDAVSLTAGANVTLTTNGNVLQVSAPNVALLNGSQTFTGNSLFTGNWQMKQGAAGTMPWNISVGNATGPAGYSFNNALVFSANGVPCLDLWYIAADNFGIWLPGGLGASEVDCGEVNVRNPSSWNTVAHIDSSGNYQANGWIMISGAVTAPVFNISSDRNLKEKFAPIDNREILERVANLPISSWNFKSDSASRHIGPMAQDFYAAFNVGMDDKHIATVDEDGVALAAIQGLNEKLKDKAAQIEVLEKRLSDLEKLVKSPANKQAGGSQ